ncbi:hypothetical protein HMJ29_00760 [Hymenobacter taeanensis]|uniref:Uncharacterized protein n=1 Tax=Hymenobacter taeanensis TaxID=2735321 RepID=A0A6M6BB90_9BACT|nr:MULTISPECIES: hypothetical protein [Hymenobacter]QJX45546.1 hypothetical protein HMJ29_00760 [Hymenobacter taeanensis]UOQ81205.1 hypothetical protein MUN83_20760 [Hymenobacter sp. 5414T-23]
MDLTNLDFQQARIKLVLFKSRLRSVIYGVREPDEALFSLRLNPLGEWLYAIVKPRYGSIPAVTLLENELSRMLDTARSLVQQHQNGKLEEARLGLERIDAHAAQLEALLGQVEQAALQ